MKQTVAFVCLLGGIVGQAAEPASAVERALAQEIIGPALSLEEVRVFNETRVPDMPRVSTAAEWQAKDSEYRRNILDKVVFRGEAAKWRDTPLRVEWSDTIEGLPGYRIRKLRFEAVPGWWIPALLYEPTKLSGKRPVVLNVNGHDGKGKAADYKQLRCINQAKRGMIALNVEWIGMGQFASRMSHYQMNQMDLCGTAGIAPFFLNMSKGLDILLAHPNADPTRVAVAGLSGGGWQTIFISSLDERVMLANPVAGYSSFKTRARHGMDLGDSEQTPNDLALYADYTHLTAMLANRAALLTNNAEDKCCFTAGHAQPPLLDAAQPIFDLLGRGEFLRSHINHDPGTHNFELDNRQQLYRFIGDVFYDGRDFSWQEIPSADEVKTYDELLVDLPEGNGDFNSAQAVRGRQTAAAAQNYQRQELHRVGQACRRRRGGRALSIPHRWRLDGARHGIHAGRAQGHHAAHRRRRPQGVGQAGRGGLGQRPARRGVRFVFLRRVENPEPRFSARHPHARRGRAGAGRASRANLGRGQLGGAAIRTAGGTRVRRPPTQRGGAARGGAE